MALGRMRQAFLWRSAIAGAIALLVMTGVAQAQWADEFNGTGGPSSGNWVHDVGAGGWGNNELQNYTAGSANAWQEAGYLRIQGKCCYTSARIKTAGIRNFGPYVRVEARLRGPMGQGLWPAFWMLGSNFGSV